MQIYVMKDLAISITKVWVIFIVELDKTDSST